MFYFPSNSNKIAQIPFEQIQKIAVIKCDDDYCWQFTDSAGKTSIKKDEKEWPEKLDADGKPFKKDKD